MRRLTPVLAVVSLLVLLVAVTGPTAVAAPGGNRANAKLCQHGGWADLQRTDGTSFANQGACVAYAAQGGTLEPTPTPRVTVSFLQGSLGDIGFCGIVVEVAGFAPDTYEVVIASERDADYPTLIRVGTDGTGTVRTIPPTLIGGTLWSAGDTVIATVAGVPSDPSVVAC